MCAGGVSRDGLQCCYLILSFQPHCLLRFHDVCSLGLMLSRVCAENQLTSAWLLLHGAQGVPLLL